VRSATFLTRTHGRAMAAPSADPSLIEQAALDALDQFTDRRPVRLLGVRAEFGLPATMTRAVSVERGSVVGD
jgi:hypothetical protein